MNQTIVVTAATFGALSVIFGAFGAHALKKIMNDEQIKNFETGVKYQMFHALVLLVVGLNTSVFTNYRSIYGCFVLGIFFFSFSIYGLTITSALQNKWKWLGPITPTGGLLFVAGWFLMIANFVLK